MTKYARFSVFTAPYIWILLLMGVGTILSGQTEAAYPRILWHIGVTNHSGKEFALFGRYSEYSQRFPGVFRYRIGVSHAADWPYIQPGPADSWAGSAEHPLVIQFQLVRVPDTECALVINTVSAQSQFPPTLQVRINGAAVSVNLPAGPGDSALLDERTGHPHATRINFDPSLLKAGANEITLTITAGSWLLYDSILLQTDSQSPPRRISGIALEPNLLFFVHWQGKLMQTIPLIVRNFGLPVHGEARIVCGSFVENIPITLQFGENRIPLPVPPVQKLVPVKVQMNVSGHTFTASGEVTPQRKWVIYIVPSVHIDIGYTDLQSVVRQRHDQNLDQVLAICQRNPNFRWNLEGTWEAVNYLSDRPPAVQREFIRLIREGRIEVTAGYCNMLTGLMSDEEMNRYAYVAARLHRIYGINVTAADLSDVPSAAWGLASALDGSGVRYFAEGINQTRALTLANSGIQSPFYWEGPDGSRLLTWLSAGYGQSIWLDQNPHPTLVQMQNWVNDIIAGYNRKSYPYSAIYVYGALYENMVVNPDYGSQIAIWNREFAYPHLVIAAEPQYFHAILRQKHIPIPVIRGSFGSFWEDGAGSSARETTLNQQSQERITAAETLWSLADIANDGVGYPVQAFDRAWNNIFLYDEHTWGAAQSISDPNSPQTREIWAVKKSYAVAAEKETRKLLQEGLSAYLHRVQARRGDLVVVNSLSWPRSGLVFLPANIPSEVRVTDPDGTETPVQLVGKRRAIYASAVPALGCKVYHLIHKSPSYRKTIVPNRPYLLENHYYQIAIDPERGVTAIIDRTDGRELEDAESPYSFGQTLYAAGGDGTRLINSDLSLPAPAVVIFKGTGEASTPPHTILLTPARITSVSPIESGPIFTEIIIHATAPSIPRIVTRIRLYNQEKRIEFLITMTKTPILQKEAVYIAFPFKAVAPRFELDTTNAVANPALDFVPGACNDWYAIRDWIACRSRSGAEVVWSSPDAPLVTLCGINRGRWMAKADIANGWIFSYVMNNYWFTNYKADQGGRFKFRYDITSSPHPLSMIACEQFGKSTANPLIAGISGGASSSQPQRLQVSGAGVEVVTIKGAENRHGIIARLRNVSLSPTTARIKLAGRRYWMAEQDNLVEEKVSSLRVIQGQVTISLKPQQTTTIRIW